MENCQSKLWVIWSKKEKTPPIWDVLSWWAGRDSNSHDLAVAGT
jgi:hypothetical protein